MTYTHDLPHEPQFPKSPETADGTSSVGGPPAHFDTLARLLSVDPELVPAALANLIASEREAAVSEFASAVDAAIETTVNPPEADEDGTVWHGAFGHSLGIQCDQCPGYPHAACIRPRDAAAIVRDLANTT